MRKTFLIAAAAASLVASLAFAEDPAPTKKAGCCGTAQASGSGCGMNAEQKKAHMEKMAGMKDEGSCKAYMDQQRKAMGCGGQDKGAMMKDMEHGCDHLKPKG